MIKINQIKKESIDKEIDLYIAASGFESRSIEQTKYFFKKSKLKFALGFKNEKEHKTRILNDAFFKAKGFEVLLSDESDINSPALQKVLLHINRLLESKDNIIVYVDYSCMTKNWYSLILYALFNTPLRKNIKAYFGYSHGKYIPFNHQSTLNRIVSPLFGYCDLNIPSRPTALIVGIGNEPNRAYGLKEYFDASPYIFYSDTSYNEKFSEEAELLNKEILSEINQNNIFKFPIHDLVYTNYVLENLCSVLLRDYRVIIAPCGPKPFALLSMINSLKFDDSVEVWRVSPGSNISSIDREATGLISILELQFT